MVSKQAAAEMRKSSNNSMNALNEHVIYRYKQSRDK